MRLSTQRQLRRLKMGKNKKKKPGGSWQQGYFSGTHFKLWAYSVLLANPKILTCADPNLIPLNVRPPSTFPPDASNEYMARSRLSPSMRDHWSAEEGARDRAAPRYRDGDRSERRPRSPPPPRRDDIDSYRGSARQEAESYRPSDRREHLRELDRPRPRRLSPSPRRGPKSKPLLPQQDRRLEDRITRPTEPSPARLTKCRRTRSPSPGRGDYYIPGQRRDSFSRYRSRSRDRRFGAVDRAFLARRSSPVKDSRSGRRPDHPPADTYIPSHPKRPRSRSVPRQHPVDRRSPSPRKRPGTPPARSDRPRRSDQNPKELSPYSTRAQKTKTLKRGRSRGA